jgi:hypothetical protein
MTGKNPPNFLQENRQIMYIKNARWSNIFTIGALLTLTCLNLILPLLSALRLS